MHLVSGCGSNCDTMKGITEIVNEEKNRSNFLSILDRFLLHEIMENVCTSFVHSNWKNPQLFVDFLFSLEKDVPPNVKHFNNLKLNLFSDFFKVEFVLNVLEELSLRNELESFDYWSDIFDV